MTETPHTPNAVDDRCVIDDLELETKLSSANVAFITEAATVSIRINLDRFVGKANVLQTPTQNLISIGMIGTTRLINTVQNCML